MAYQLQALATQDPAVYEWLMAKRSRSDFAASLCSFYERKGTLTPGQTQAVLNAIARDAKTAELQKNAPVFDVSTVERAFEQAAAAGLKSPAFTVGDYRFSLAKPDSINAGALYVKEQGEYLGKIVGGRLLLRRDPADKETLYSILRDPAAATAQHGKLTGRCSVCSRKLSDQESVSRGIGPICAERFGW